MPRGDRDSDSMLSHYQHSPHFIQSDESVALRFHGNGSINNMFSLSLPSQSLLSSHHHRRIDKGALIWFHEQQPPFGTGVLISSARFVETLMGRPLGRKSIIQQNHQREPLLTHRSGYYAFTCANSCSISHSAIMSCCQY